MDEKNTNMIYCGCNPSVIDGTEHIFTVDDKIELPSTFNWENSMPPVRNLGLTLTCVCQTLTGMLDFYYNSINNTPNKCNRYSISELYNTRANKRVEGMTIKEALHYLLHVGLNNNKILNYARIPSIEDIKTCIVMFGPVAAGFKCFSGNKLYFWREHGQYLGGHCITLVGYTETGFIIRNSWGNEWGYNGYFEIPYEEFGNACFEAWTFTI